MERRWQDFVANQEVLVAMRFSYFGKSGWQGDASKHKDMLFKPQRLALRLAMLESLAIPSLAAQSDQNFHLMILCSEDLPAAALDSLTQVCAGTLAPEKYSICPRPFGASHTFLTKFLKRRYGLGQVIQTVLDDDDAFASNLIARIREELLAMPEPQDETVPRFVSFIDGFGLDLKDRETGNFSLYSHRYPFVNLGLTMVGPSGGKNLFSIRHRKVPAQGNAKLVKGSPMFVRTLHGLNDSRACVTERWRPMQNWRTDPKISDRFPFLGAI